MVEGDNTFIINALGAEMTRDDRESQVSVAIKS
jgi:hypothetical protein